MNVDGYKLYIRIDVQDLVIDGYADWQTDRRDDDEILICDDGPRHFHLYWPEPLTNERGQYRYKWIDGERVERSAEELDAEWAVRPPAQPTVEDKIALMQAALDDLILGGAL